MKNKPYISVVSPVYLAEKIIPQLVHKLKDILSDITEYYEIILVEDGSPDHSWNVIVDECERESRIVGIKLSRNFGQHNAITAGLDAALGDWIVVMDCDLQDRPEEILNLYRKAQEGYSVVVARRVIRQDSFMKKWSSKLFYKIFSFLTNTKQDPAVANFGIYHRKVIDAVLSMGDYIRYFPAMIQWVGFRVAYIDVMHAKSKRGQSSYSWSSLIYLAVKNIISFSEKPLHIVVWFGLTITFFSFCIGLWYLVKYLGGYVEVLGYTSLIISIWFLSGIMIFIIGVVGVYVGKNFEKSKNRPVYIVEQKIVSDDES